MQRQFRLGGVAPKTTCLRGQSIIEYVLIIAVIGLVIVFAGPGVAGAIRNQFNLVGNTLNSGTGGDSFMSAEEKAHQEAMKSIAAKEAKDWTLDEQKAAADDIAKNGTSSVVYAKAEAAMKAKTEWSVKLTNGKTMTYRIIGINHDDLADGSGKAGLTFEASSASFGEMNSPKRSDEKFDGWEKSEMRKRLNSGDLWNLLPSDLKTGIRAVTKETGKKSVRVHTVDKLFLISAAEMYAGMYSGTSDTGGYQYEYYSLQGYFSSSWISVDPLFCSRFSDDGPRYPAWAFSCGGLPQGCQATNCRSGKSPLLFPTAPIFESSLTLIREDTFMADSEARLFDATGKSIGTYKLEVMDTFWKRFMGLMGRDDVPIGNAALFRKCSSIHMFFMKVPLDVIWYGMAMPDGRVPVLSVARDVKPWQIAFGPKRTRGCLEVADGTVPKNLDAIEIVTASSERPETTVTRRDYRDIVRDRIQVTRCNESAPHLGGAAAIQHGHTF